MYGKPLHASDDPGEGSADVAGDRVVEALGNEVRSELEIAKTARVTFARIQISNTFLVAHVSVVECGSCNG
jgi:hypothetical protein